MQKLAIISAALWLTPLVVDAQAQENVIAIRATHAHVPAEVVEYVARSTMPTDLTQAEFRNDATSSPQAIIGQLCGTVTDAYYRVFEAANNASINRHDPLGNRANTLTWPACLYVSEVPNAIDVSSKREAVAAYREMTGDLKGGQYAWSRYFGIRPRDVTQFRTLSAPHVTSPFVVALPAGTNSRTFLHELRQASAKSGGVVRTIASPGSIDLSVDETANTCAPFSEAPFDATDIEVAYIHGRELGERLGILQATAKVAIVDNGFFGAKAGLNENPFQGSPFDARFFRRDSIAKIARYIDGEPRIWPLNYSNGLSPDTTSGHGTHVTGLVLGGPSLDKFRNNSINSSHPWIEITTVNLGNGTGSILRGMQTKLAAILNVDAQHRIVNLSVAHDGTAYPDTKADYRNLFLGSENANLFIVSAGNFTQKMKDVSASNMIPAAIGRGFRNVIVVASIDGNNRLSAFSGTGQAVDIAAPGCKLSSWLDNTKREVRLSGTSQAAPLVTLAASLLRALSANALPVQLRNRLIVSGDLLDRADQSSLRYPVQLNIPRALYWFDDILARRDTGKIYLGQALSVTGIQCATEGFDKPFEDIWSIKFSADRPWLFHGRNSDTVSACSATLAGDGAVTFKPLKEIYEGRLSETSEPQFDIAIDQVSELLIHTDISD